VSYTAAGLLCRILVQACCVIYRFRVLRHIFHSQPQKFTKLCAKNCINKNKYSIRNFGTIMLFICLKFRKTNTNGSKAYYHQHIGTDISCNSHFNLLLSGNIQVYEEYMSFRRSIQYTISGLYIKWLCFCSQFTSLYTRLVVIIGQRKL